MDAYESPSLDKSSFTCPWCEKLAPQEQFDLVRPGQHQPVMLDGFSATQCANCDRYVLWHEVLLIYPAENWLPPHSVDMPIDLTGDYEEARSIFSASPRASVGVLRFVLQALCLQLGLPGQDLRADVIRLEQRYGLPLSVPSRLQMTPGQLDPSDASRDDRHFAQALCGLINDIVDAARRTGP